MPGPKSSVLGFCEKFGIEANGEASDGTDAH